MNRKTKSVVGDVDDAVWLTLGSDKRIISLARWNNKNNLPHLLFAALKKANKSSIEKVEGCTHAYRKSTAWNEAIETAKSFFIRMVDNCSGAFEEKELEEKELE